MKKFKQKRFQTILNLQNSQKLITNANIPFQLCFSPLKKLRKKKENIQKDFLRIYIGKSYLMKNLFISL